MPTVVLHGVRQVCTEKKITELVDIVAEEMDSHVECIEIGNGDITSIFSSIMDQAIEACEKVKSNKYFANSEFNIVALS